MRSDEPRHPRTEPRERCPVCLHEAASLLFEAPDRMLGVGGVYRYRRCGACRSVFQDPAVVEADLERLYPRGYYTHAAPRERLPTVERGSGRTLRSRLRAGVMDAVSGAAGGGGALLARARWVRERAFFDLVPDEMLPRTRPPGRALDVGCGSGRLLARLQALGWEVEGVEPDRHAAQAAREATGRPVHLAGVGALPESLGSFRLVTLSHVFEHLREPGEALASLGERLEPGGRLVLLWPNPGALGARRWKRDWFAWDPPRHLVLPSRESLPGLARKAGLRLRSLRTSARQAVMNDAHSRAYRRGRKLERLDPGWRERAFGVLERMLVVAGLPLGEELVAVLEREDA